MDGFDRQFIPQSEDAAFRFDGEAQQINHRHRSEEANYEPEDEALTLGRSPGPKGY